MISEAKQASQMKMACNALHTVLCAVSGSGKPADRVLSAFFRDNPRCGSRDRRLISELVYAVLRTWGILRQTLENPEAMEAGEHAPSARELQELLARGAYLAAADFPAGRLARIPLPHPGASLLDRAGKLLGKNGLTEEILIPAWVKKHLAPDFPLQKYLEKLASRPPMWIRRESGGTAELAAELAAAGLTAVPHEYARDALSITDAAVNLYTLPAYTGGSFEVQDLASQCIGLAAAPSTGERWLDACAGAGGKTLQLASMMKNKGTIVASDIREYKLEDLRKRARRAGFSNIQTRAWDGKTLRPQLRESFDGVLVDAPCSCSGVWRRNPDGIWSARESAIAETAAIQSGILDAVAPGVKAGGVLIYATCSMFMEENELQAEAFLKRHPEFVPERFPHPLTGEDVVSGMLQITPADADCDAMFVARMRKLKGVR